MAVQLNHTVVHAHDRRASAEFLAEVLGLTVGAPLGPFLPIDTGNGVTLDYLQTDDDFTPTHYAFLVPDEEFDTMIDRLKRLRVTYFADPNHSMPGQINHRYQGRGAYFADPSGHNMEILTRPYTR